MKQIFLLILGALALAGNLKAMSADEAALAALYPAHETFFQNELHPVADSRVESTRKITVTSMDLLLVVHVSELGQ